MTDLRTAAQQALEFIKVTNARSEFWLVPGSNLNKTVTALKSALEQPEQEPVAWIQSNHLQLAQRGPFSCRVEPTQRHPDFVPLYTHPPRREWRGLTEEEINEATFHPDGCMNTHIEFARAVEAKLKERNA